MRKGKGKEGMKRRGKGSELTEEWKAKGGERKGERKEKVKGKESMKDK